MSPHTDPGALLKLADELIAFFNFINEPPQYEDQRMVRDYRHELARLWMPLHGKINAALAASHGREGGEALAWRWRIKNAKGHHGRWELSTTEPKFYDVPHDCEPLYALPPPVKTGGEAETPPKRPDSIYSQFHLDNWTDEDFAKHSAATRKTVAWLLELEAALPKLTEAGENKQHIAWLYQFVRCMNERNWRDMRDNLENQLERMTGGDPAQAPSEPEDGAEIVFLDHSGEQHRIVYDIREDHPGLGSGWFLHVDDALQTNQPKLEGQNRILADRMWRTPEKRKQFETETGLSDELTEEYQTRFIRWALATLSVPSAHRGGE